MPDDRSPRPVRLNAAPRSKPPLRPRTPKRPRRPRDDCEKRLLTWITVGLLAALAALVVIYIETPAIKGWFAPNEAAYEHPENAEPLPQEKTVPPPATPPAAVTSVEDERMRKLKAVAAEETRKLQERTEAVAPAPLASPSNATPPPPAAVATTSAPVPGEPPLVQPVPTSPHGAPARALPLDTGKLDTERIAAYQVALERMHFSCGFIDGDQGMRTQRMLRAFQSSRGLPATGMLDPATCAVIGEPGEPFLTYTVKPEDVAAIMPKPQSWREKAKAPRLGYNEIWELLAEKFHCTRAYLKGLNPGVVTPVAGTELVGPKVFPAAPIPKAASLRINLAETSIEALDAGGRVIAFFPCSIAKDKAKRPHGRLEVKVVDPNPDYTFDPALFADAAKAENITHRMTLPPGPRNPVGTTWVGLNLPGYGIHGTPEPENISRTQSHGCFRLANWNAEKVLKMVRVGTPVDVVE